MSGIHWVTEPNAYLEPKIGKTGYAAQPPKTVIQTFQDTVRKHGNENAMAAKLKVNVRVKFYTSYFSCCSYDDSFSL